MTLVVHNINNTFFSPVEWNCGSTWWSRRIRFRTWHPVRGLQESLNPGCTTCVVLVALLCRSHLLSLYCPSPLRPTARDDSESLAERFSGRVAPFSGSDQVSAVVKLSLLGRKTSKTRACEGSTSPLCLYMEPLSLLFLKKSTSFCVFFKFHSNTLKIFWLKVSQPRGFNNMNGAPNLLSFNSHQVHAHIFAVCCSKYFPSAVL